MISKAQYNCRTCDTMFTARTADRDRGWAQFCSKACKAVTHEAKKKMWKTLTKDFG
jgi:predicted transglutaminase-like cysteine proteinase